MAELEPESHLFKEVNALRHGSEEIDQDELERAKLNNTIFGKIAGSKKFEYTTLTIIMMNAGYLGYDGDFSARFPKPENLYDCEHFPADECVQFAVFEVFFAAYFTFEIVVRFLAYRRKRDCLTDGWFVFDSILVTIMVIETWILPFVGASGPLAQLSVLRLLRLLRITRMAKLLRYLPELQIIVKGMAAAVRSVACTAVLQILILYVFSILFTSEFHQGNSEDDAIEGYKPEYLFGSIRKSMRNLFVMGTILDDITLCCNSILGSNKPIMIAFFILFVLVSSFTLLNMLVGILCEVVCAVGHGQRNKNMEANVRESIKELFNGMDEDQNGQISREEFMQMKDDAKVMKALEELQVKPKHFAMYADLMFKQEVGAEGPPMMDFEKTVSLILRLRPGSTVKSLDFASFQSSVQKKHEAVRKHLDQIEQMASVLTGKDLAGVRMSVSNPAIALQQLSGSFASEHTATYINRDKFSVSVPQKLDNLVSDVDIILELQRRMGLTHLKKEQKMLQTCFDMDYTDLPDQPGPTDFADYNEWSEQTYAC